MMTKQPEFVRKNIERELVRMEKRRQKLLDEVAQLDTYVAKLKEFKDEKA